MPSSRPAPQPARGGPTRRQLLGSSAYAAGALAATTGCGLRIDTGPAPAPAPLPPSPDELARERAAAAADRLLSSTLALRLVRPDVGPQLTRIAAEHRAHAEALRPVPAAAASPTATTTSTSAPTGERSDPRPSPTATGSRSGDPAPDASDPVRLAAAERTAANAALTELSAVSPAAARLLASVAAARLVHADLLAALPPARRAGRPTDDPA